MQTDRAAYLVEHADRLRRADPLAFFRFSSTTQRDLVHYVSQDIEVWWRSGNEGGKSYASAMLAVAFARGVTRIDGSVMQRDGSLLKLPDLILPKLRSPNVGAILVPSKDEQVEAVQAAFLELIGDHPHHIGWDDKKRGVIAVLYVKPDGSRERSWERWSKIRFHSAGGADRSLPGARLDWAGGDEPPLMRQWREMRARGRRNQIFPCWIAGTPLERYQWEELAEDFKLCRGRVHQGRIELKSSVTDNQALSDQHLTRLKQRWANDPLVWARWSGDYVDRTGKCPFTIAGGQIHPTIERWESEAQEPQRVPVQIQTEVDTQTGVQRRAITIEFEEFEPSDPKELYFVVLDPSLGIDDPEHDPAGALVIARRRPRIVATYLGPLSGWGLGFLGGLLHSRYNQAMVDILMGGGYGRSCLSGLDQSGCHKIMIEEREDRLGQVQYHLGFNETPENRGTLIGEVFSILDHRSVECPSLAVAQCLRGVVVDKHGKIAAKGRQHDEYMLLLGRAGMLLRENPVSAPPPVPESDFAGILNREFGRPVASSPRANGKPGGLRWRR